MPAMHETAQRHKPVAITPEIVAGHGLKPDEYQRLLKILGREPSLTELGIFSVMWSEHCSYKSSRVWLKKLPTTGPQVIQGPGENGGVVSGIGDYGNCMGVPTIGGETNFDARYNDNILVNAMTVGLVDAKRIFKSAAKGIGHPVVYVGSKTGRDGIHGATMASAAFDDASEEKRPTVQVGD